MEHKDDYRTPEERIKEAHRKMDEISDLMDQADTKKRKSWPKLRATLKSILDGIATYLAYYLWTAFVLWLGCKLMGLPLSYWPFIGFVLVFRQIVGLIAGKTDRHLKDEPVKK